MYQKPMALDRLYHKDFEVHPLAKASQDMFGVEIELEGLNLSSSHPSIMKWWEVHKENSLRTFKGNDAIEYTFSAPLNRADTTVAIGALYDHLTHPGVTVFDSYRTSIHVHLNMGLETYRTIYNFITLCIMFDELLTSKTGDHRIGNNFCLRSRDAEGQLVMLTNSIRTHGNWFHMSMDHRYSSINYASLLKFGTIEFRSLECTTDRKRLERWIDTLQQIKKVARSFADPVAVVERYQQVSPTLFLSEILGTFASDYMGVNGWQEMIRYGHRLACDFAYCSKWTNKPETQKDNAEKAMDLKKKAVKKKNPFNTLDPYVSTYGVPTPAPTPKKKINPYIKGTSEWYDFELAKTQALWPTSAGGQAAPQTAANEASQWTTQVYSDWFSTPPSPPPSDNF